MMDEAGRDDDPPGVSRFFYHRAIAPMMWVLLGLVCIEAFITHFLIALWSARIALILSSFSLATLIWLILFIRSFRFRPVIIQRDQLIWPAGSLRTVTVPLAQIRRRHDHWTLDAIRREGVFNAALITHPNIVIELDPPLLSGQRIIRYLAHKLDDPQAFNAALDDLLTGDDRFYR